MSILELVPVSGTVGVAVRGTARQSVLKSITLTPSGANATVKVREGITSAGTVVFFGRAPSAQGSKQFELDESGVRFDHGLHVTVIGTNAQAYVELN